MAGRIDAPGGAFDATTLTAGVAWEPTALALAGTDGGAIDPTLGSSDAWRWSLVDKAYWARSGAHEIGGGAYRRPIQLAGIGVDKPITGWLSLTARGYAAWRGEVGGYAEGLFGGEASWAPLARWTGHRLFVTAEGGAGGGGGVDTGGGLIGEIDLGWRWQVARSWSLAVACGRLWSEGSFTADVATLSLSWTFERLIAR
jgi:hypothetical protein